MQVSHRHSDHAFASTEFADLVIDAHQMPRVVLRQHAAEHAGSGGFALHGKKLDRTFLAVAEARLHAKAAAIFPQLSENVRQRFNADAGPITFSFEHERVREGDAVIGADIDEDAAAFSAEVSVDNFVLAETGSCALLAFGFEMERLVAHCRIEREHAVGDGGVAVNEVLTLSHEQHIEQALFRLLRTAVGTEMQSGPIVRPCGLRVENSISVGSNHPFQEGRIVRGDKELV